MGKSLNFLKFLETIFYRHESCEGRLLLKYFGYLMLSVYLFMMLLFLILFLYLFETVITLIIFLFCSCLYLGLYPKYRDYFDFEDL